ncbi:hypothetical protein GHC21_00595 [Kluyvera intermedia]|uniref:Uncharacterized protein n=1 Tax=Kluyvera intermedia TaxID=61648 RepID=A0ABX6DHI7_KLUIN|nr:hypothetical protein GHC21_00595 [Kluyvera intermedia]QGH37227.1 hypothetical protein GHC38_00595 [Kluyvera intermedia]
MEIFVFVLIKNEMTHKTHTLGSRGYIYVAIYPTQR